MILKVWIVEAISQSYVKETAKISEKETLNRIRHEALLHG